MTYKLFVALIFSITSVNCFAQQSNKDLYDVNANGLEQIEEAKAIAKETNKHILLQIGGNWCKWCRIFNTWSHETPSVDSLLKSDYVVVHVNHSKENKNEETLQSIEFLQRFGFPVFVVLDTEGKRLHTQNTAYLEAGEGYDEKKVIEFLKHWNVIAVSKESYSSE